METTAPSAADPQMGDFATAIVGLDGTILACDAVYAALLRKTPSQMIGSSVSDHADVASGYSPAFMINLLLRTRQPLLTMRDYVRADGSKVLCEVQLCLLKNAAGEPDRIYVLAQPLRPDGRRAPSSIDRQPPNA